MQPAPTAKRLWIFAATVLLATAGISFADETPAAPAPTAPVPQSASVGGGIKNPWRPPYRTALVQPRVALGQ